MLPQRSLYARIFRTILTLGLINLAVVLLAVELVYEDMEETSLTEALTEEYYFFANRIDGPSPQSWQTALLTVHFLPEGDDGDSLPGLFNRTPVPFSDEVHIGNDTYLIITGQTASPAGALYLAQDISALENREDLLQSIGYLLFTLTMLMLSYALAKAGTGYIVSPLQRLSTRIRGIDPENPLTPMAQDYRDRELNDITRVLNGLLTELRNYIAREKSLISQTSHELRTPIAVISGALDVLDQRNTLTERDRETLTRIRNATNVMQADVNALLKLARKRDSQPELMPVALATTLNKLVEEFENCDPANAGRIDLQICQAAPCMRSDPAMVHMLIRNLLQNALRHTGGQVTLNLQETWLEIRDSGCGMPDSAIASLNDRDTLPNLPQGGIGLYLVRVIADYLGWEVRLANRPDQAGTLVRVTWPAECVIPPHQSLQ